MFLGGDVGEKGIRVDGDGVFHKAKEGEIGFAIRVGPSVRERQAEVDGEEVAHGGELGLVFVIGAGDFWEKRHGVGEAQSGADAVVEAEAVADGLDVKVGAGGV